MLDKKTLSILKNIFDYVIEFKVLETNEKYERALRVSKSSCFYIDDFIPYELRETGITPSTEIIEEFNRVKQHIIDARKRRGRIIRS